MWSVIKEPGEGERSIQDVTGGECNANACKGNKLSWKENYKD